MRLVTRGDMDGLTAAVLLSTVEQIDEIELIHPQDVTDGRFVPREGDILVNLPWAAGCAKWFDHHQPKPHMMPPEGFDGLLDKDAPSAARVVYRYYDDPALDRYLELLSATDRMDSADLSPEDIIDPQGYILLGFTIDSRTGLGRFKDYFHLLLDLLQRAPLEEILHRTEVVERVVRMQRKDEEFRRLLREHSVVRGNTVVTDFRNLEGSLPVGNRFLIYTLFPGVNVSLRIHWGPNREFAVVAVGHSIFNRTCTVNLGQLMARYGGGGHRGAGSTPVPPDKADEALEEIVSALNA